MAGEMLQLKVSEDQYRKTLENLQAKMQQLQTIKNRLQAQKNNLQKAYNASEVKSALNAIAQYEQRTQEAYEEVSNQRQKIQDYLDAQNRVSGEAESEFGQRLQEASQRFGA